LRAREPRVRVHVELDAEIVEQLDAQAAQTGRPRWAIVQEALVSYWRGHLPAPLTARLYFGYFARGRRK
jgi:hypothetical protein